jgi:PII-like signaling protein
MEEPTTATKLTVYIGDSDKHGRKLLHLAIVEHLHAESISGATVVHGIKGYGAHKQIHTARILDLSGDLPVVITAVDLPEKIAAGHLPSLAPALISPLPTGLPAPRPG